MTPPEKPPCLEPSFPGLLLCLFVSGASGLIYEVAWVRSLELVFGATSLAIATTLAAFMGGLAVGSRWMGAEAPRLERFHPLRIYAVLECLIGLCGLLVPLALHALVPLYQSIWSQFHASFAVFSLCRFVLCGAILLIPTALMGATLPIASRIAVAASRLDDGGRAGGTTRTGGTVGLLYACNTLGAVAGCSLAGLALLPSLGLRRTEWLAVGLNLAAAALALLLARRRGAGLAADGPPRESARIGEQTSMRGRAFVLTLLYATSGALAMVYEVAWGRLLVLVLGSSTYSYTIMLTTFLSGLAIGAWVGARSLRTFSDPILAAALCQVQVALTTYFGLYLFKELPFLYVVAYHSLQPSPRGLLIVQLALACGVMILPTIGLGAMFPITIDGLRAKDSETPLLVGRAYAWNTVGAILGSIVTGFWLVPRWGSRDALLLGVFGSALLGLSGLMLTRPARGHRLSRLLAASVVIFLVNMTVAAPALPPEILSSGVFRYATRYRGADRATFDVMARAYHGEILMFEEGLTSTVTVFRTTAARTLLVNGKPDASAPPGLAEPPFQRTTALMGDLSTQVLMGQAPLLLARRADRVLMIGLGSGVSLGSVLTHPVQEVECVELEDAVVRGSRFFDDVSGAPLRDSRVRLVVNDARNHLLVTKKTYDVIISEPSNPWVAGAASLFTKDFFELASDRLVPDGLFGQWLQLYEMTADDFAAILRGFTSVFPETQVFRVGTDAILVGSRGGAPIGLDPILAGFPGPAAADLARIGIHTPGDFLAHQWIGGAELRAALRPGPLNTDDNMLIEFTAPLRMLARRVEDQSDQVRGLALIFSGHTSGIRPHLAAGPDGGGRSRFWAQMSEATLAGGYPDLAFSYAGHSLEAEPNPRAARVYGVSLALGGRPAEALRALEGAAREFPRDAPLLRSLIGLERARSDWHAVRRHAGALLRLAPGDHEALYWTGESQYRLGDRAAAYASLKSLVAAENDSALGRGTAAESTSPRGGAFPDLDLMIGSLASALGRYAEAIPPLRAYLREHPAERDTRALLADALERAGRTREAQAERRRLAPDAQGQAEERLARVEAARESPDRNEALLGEAREFDPDNDRIAFLLARSLARRGDRTGAAALLEEFLAAHPDRPWAIGYLAQVEEETGDVEGSRLLAQRHLALTGRRFDRVTD
ncbi:MAG TPA: fused MFS/spermidine synthase [Candidatus Polarisedimenticolia bacterium]|nr:fused MFS/spermidine synthase [Candidatus Polarisedimenticolia bacterium]